MFLLGSLLILLAWLRVIGRTAHGQSRRDRSRQPGTHGELTPPQP
jgi:hypothetical protein